MKARTLFFALTILVTVITLVPNVARAHFPWLIVNDDGKPVLFFGEDLGDRTYHLPTTLAAFPLKQIGGSSSEHELTMESIESDNLVGLVATEPVAPKGCIVGFMDKDTSGTFNDEAYASASNYLTATFVWKLNSAPVTDSAQAKVKQDVQVVASEFPDLPTELTSFGGAIAGGKLYVYGGHIGEAHSYSTAEQSDVLWSLDVKNPKSWEQLASGPRLQGMAMVAHNESVVRIGGFTALNAKGEKHDLHSQASVARFDASSNHWTELAPLPEPRSSHAAVVVGNQVYVVGGWSMAGDGDSQWRDTAWTANLSQQPIVWTKIATPPFQRRALALAAHDGKIFAIGGMGQEGGPQNRR